MKKALPNNTILLASPVSDFIGGAERSMYELIKNIKGRGYNPVVILPRPGKIQNALKKEGVKTYCVNFDWWARGISTYAPPFSSHKNINGEAVVKITTIINTVKPFACVSYTAVFPWLAYASFICNIPHIWQVCEILDDEKHWALRMPIPVTLNYINELSVKIFANSSSCKKHLEKYIPNPKEEIGVIYPFVDQDRIKGLSAEKLNHNQKSDLCLVGNIQPEKGQLDAVRAVAKLKKEGTDITLNLIGREINSSYKKEILQVIKESALEEKVKFVPHTNNPYIHIKNADIALVCSPKEPFGRVTIEAMTIGTPIIGASSEGTREIIQSDGLYGLLYEPGNYGELAKKIGILLKDKLLQKNLSNKAQVYVNKKFTLKNNQRLFFEYLEKTAPHKKIQPDTPFTDIVFSYQHQSKLQKQNHHKVLQLQQENTALHKQIDDILSSKKYRALSKVASIKKKFNI